jgi:hypothetical protein
MIAENDNMTLERFKQCANGAPFLKTGAYIDGPRLSLFLFQKVKGQFRVLKVRPKPIRTMVNGKWFEVNQPYPLAGMPHPMCPPWDGTRPGMSRGYPVEKKPEPKARPSFLRVVE